MQAIFETIFDIIYLSTVITLGIQMITGSRGDKQFRLYGIMAVVLGCGDAFHLVPRAVALCTTGLASYTAVSVSYTYLDVYKRQRTSCIAGRGNR